MAKIWINGKKKKVPSGNKPREKRRKPYPPSFKSKLARIIEPIVGASTWASGNQIWNGNIGILAEKVINISPQAKTCWFELNK